MKKPSALLCAVATCFTTVFCQSPGGVSNNTFWLKSNGTIVSPGPVTSWTSQGSLTPALTQSTVAATPLFVDGSSLAGNYYNYCPYVSFDGNDRLANGGSFDFGTATGAGHGITQFSVYRINAISPVNPNVLFDWSGPNASIKNKGYDDQVVTDAGGWSGSGNQFAVPVNVDVKIQHLCGFSDGLNTSYGNGFSGYNHIPLASYGAVSSNDNPFGSGTRLAVGSNVNSGEYLKGSIAEIIIFNGILNAAEMLRVNSYLAVKYGITLGGNGSVTNYLSSSGGTIWNSVSAYHNKVIGIGRDNGGAGTSGLLQKQSHTSDDSVRLYISSLALTNAANTGSFSANRSFVMMGGNNGKLCATLASNAEIPPASASCDIDSRLEREWLVQRTNCTEAFNLNVKLAGCAAPGMMNPSDLVLLVDDDGNFTNAQCFGASSGLSFSYAAPLLTVSGISTTHIPNNSARYITIASSNPATPLPVELLFFDAVLRGDRSAADLLWRTETEKNSGYFEVQKLSEGSWQTFATLPAAGNSQNPRDYAAEDLSLSYGENYYRLKLVDLDGKSDYSEVRVVSVSTDGNLLIFPNPANDRLRLCLDHIAGKQISVRDETGREVNPDISVADSNTVSIATSKLANGVYFVTVSGEQTQRFVVQH